MPDLFTSILGHDCRIRTHCVWPPFRQNQQTQTCKWKFLTKKKRHISCSVENYSQLKREKTECLKALSHRIQAHRVVTQLVQCIPASYRKWPCSKQLLTAHKQVQKLKRQLRGHMFISTQQYNKPTRTATLRSNRQNMAGDCVIGVCVRE